MNSFVDFRYAAAFYLWAWYKIDKPIFERLQQQIDVETLAKFFQEYRVARTIPGKGSQRLRHFAGKLAECRAEELTRDNVSTIVQEFAEQMKAKYGRGCTSAVSKAMWMVHRHPVAIFDSYALKSLQKNANSLTSYKDFYRAWLELYDNKLKEIRAAQEWLAKFPFVSRLVSHGVATEEAVKTDIKSDWFGNRIFDQWLVKRSDSTTNVDVAVYLGREQ